MQLYQFKAAFIRWSGWYAGSPKRISPTQDERVETFDFADGLLITLIDYNALGAGTVALQPGNVLTTNGGYGNAAGASFGIQLVGTFSSIEFATNINAESPESVGFSLAVEESNFGAVPVPTPVWLLLAGLMFRRRVFGR